MNLQATITAGIALGVAEALKSLAEPTSTPTPDFLSRLLSEAPSEWRIGTDDIDVLTNQRRIILSRNAVIGEYTTPIRPRIVIRCSAGEIDIWVQWANEPVFTEELPEVTHRLGDYPVLTMTWSRSTDRDSTFFGGHSGFTILSEHPSDLDEAALLWGMYQQADPLLFAVEFVVRTAPPGQSNWTAIFILNGLREKLDDSNFNAFCPFAGVW